MCCWSSNNACSTTKASAHMYCALLAMLFVDSSTAGYVAIVTIISSGSPPVFLECTSNNVTGCLVIVISILIQVRKIGGDPGGVFSVNICTVNSRRSTKGHEHNLLRDSTLAGLDEFIIHHHPKLA